MQREYRHIVFTNHALERLQLRRITQEMVASAIYEPDRREREADGDIEFIKTIQGRKVHVIAFRLNDEQKWLVKSTWVRGESDHPLLGRLWAFIRKLLKGGSRQRR